MNNSKSLDNQHIGNHSKANSISSVKVSNQPSKSHVERPITKPYRIVFDCLVFVFLIVGPGIVYGG